MGGMAPVGLGLTAEVSTSAAGSTVNLAVCESISIGMWDSGFLTIYQLQRPASESEPG
jgi:hypothetical protein